jgi:FKBP-type peptidyl-prolyl cis-trans isomerase FkpA
MQKTIACLLVIALLASSCLKKEGGCPYSETNLTAPAQEQSSIESYLSAHGLTATKHPSGLYYEIVKPGTDAAPNLCSQVQVGYTGTLTNGSVFDYSSSTVFTLGSLIEGWKKGLPLVQKGGQIKLYIPPALGYGYSDMKDQNGNTIIPGGSILIFDITLSNVN